MIEKLSWNLAYKLLKLQNEQVIDSDECEVIKYGIECIINTCIPITFFIIFSIATGNFLEMLIWLITFLLLRNYTGGYHATSHFKCIFFSIIYGIISLCSIDILVNLNPLFKFIIWDVIFIIHIIFEPIISCKQNQTTSYKKHTKVKIYTILIIAGLLIVTLSYFHPSIGTAIFTGIISAEILYLVEKYIILCPTKSYNG